MPPRLRLEGCLKGSSAKSDTSKPRAIDTSIGTPAIEPETSTRAVSAPLFDPVAAICSTTSFFMLAPAHSRGRLRGSTRASPNDASHQLVREALLTLIFAEERTASRRFCRCHSIFIVRKSIPSSILLDRQGSISRQFLIQKTSPRLRRRIETAPQLHRSPPSACRTSFVRELGFGEARHRLAVLRLRIAAGEELRCDSNTKGRELLLRAAQLRRERRLVAESRSLRSCST